MTTDTRRSGSSPNIGADGQDEDRRHAWMVEFDGKTAPAERFRLFREEHHGRADLVLRRLSRHLERVAKEKQPARWRKPFQPACGMDFGKVDLVR